MLFMPRLKSNKHIITKKIYNIKKSLQQLFYQVSHLFAAMCKLSVTSVNTLNNIVFLCLYISSWFCKNNYHYDITKVSLVPLNMMEHCRLCSQNFAAWKIFLKVAYLENVNLYGLFCKGQRGQKGTHMYAKFLLLRSTSKKIA